MLFKIDVRRVSLATSKFFCLAHHLSIQRLQTERCRLPMELQVFLGDFGNASAMPSAVNVWTTACRHIARSFRRTATFEAHAERPSLQHPNCELCLRSQQSPD